MILVQTLLQLFKILLNFTREYNLHDISGRKIALRVCNKVLSFNSTQFLSTWINYRIVAKHKPYSFEARGVDGSSVSWFFDILDDFLLTKIIMMPAIIAPRAKKDTIIPATAPPFNPDFLLGVLLEGVGLWPPGGGGGAVYGGGGGAGPSLNEFPLTLMYKNNYKKR